MKMFSVLLFSLFSYSAFANQCDIEPVGGQYGVRELRTSGWVYIVRGLSYSEATDALERLKSSGRCN